MEPITLTVLAMLLTPYFQKAGEKLSEKTVELALEKREDIKESFLNLFKGDEIISLDLNKREPIEQAKALLEAKPEIELEVRQKVESNQILLGKLLAIIKEQVGTESSQITINAKNIGQVINNPTGDVVQHNTWS
jgi:hypothetical protein